MNDASTHTGKRPQVVLLPGSLCDARAFGGQHGALAHGADVFAADLTQADTITALAEDVLAQAPATFIAVGLSLGAIVAAELTRVAPGRVTAVAIIDANLASVKRAGGWVKCCFGLIFLHFKI